MATSWAMGAGRRGRLLTPFRILTVLLLAGMIGAVTIAVMASRWAPPRDRFPVQGVVVNADNGEIAWPTVYGAGADFAYIRASSGSGARDPAFARNWEGARQSGIRYGAVHRFNLCQPASDQARLFIATVPRDNDALPPVVSLGMQGACAHPPDRDRLLSELNIFLNEVEAHAGKPAVLRLSEPLEAAYDISGGINRTIWLNSALLEPDYGAHPWVMWTANPWKSVDGISGLADWTVVQP